MPQVPLLVRSPVTVAYLTLRLHVVREIPALTGDMRPELVPGVPGIAFDGDDLVQLPGFDAALSARA